MKPTARPSDTPRHGAGDEDGRRIRPRDPRPPRDPRLTSHSHPNSERNPMTTQTLELDDLARTRDAHVAALNANDADGWVACFAPGAVQMPPNDPANVGTANIHALVRGHACRLQRRV